MIHGSLVPNITLFDASGAVDAEKCRWHMEWMFRHGVDGLFLTGSYGAGPLMTVAERSTIFEIASAAASEFPGKQLIAHVGCIDTASTVALAAIAERTGMDAVAAVPPFYYKYDESTIVGFYEDIVAATTLPVFAYNNPSTSRFSFTPSVVRRLQGVGIAGVKDSPLNVGFVTRVFYDAKLAGIDFQFIPGTSTGWLEFHNMGARAMIGGMNNWAPEILTELVGATASGNRDRAELVYSVMMDVSAKMHFTDSTIASQMALYARGFNGGFARKPMSLPPFDDPQYKKILPWLEDSFDRLGLKLELGDIQTVA